MRFTVVLVLVLGSLGFAQDESREVLPLPKEAASSSEVVPALTGKPGQFPNLKLGEKRSFRLVVPENYQDDKAAPLLFDFHGLGMNANMEARLTRMETDAAKRGYLVLTPTAEGGRWNLKAGKDNPDLKFFDDLLAAVQAKYKIDERRIYVTGMSMGGFFSNFLVGQRSEVLAAAAPHSGGGIGLTKGKTKVPVMIIHGDADSIVKVDQGRRLKDRYEKDGHVVNYVEIAGLGHTWAHKEKINGQILDFFEKHPRAKAEK